MNPVYWLSLYRFILERMIIAWLNGGLPVIATGSTPADGETLIYSAASGTWVPTAPGAASAIIPTGSPLSGAAGSTGDRRVDDQYLYIKTPTQGWGRVPLMLDY